MPRFEASEDTRHLAGPRRVASKHALHSNQNMQIPQIPIQDTSTPFTLPTGGAELRHLPYSRPDPSIAMPLLNPDLYPATDHFSYGPIVDNGGSWPTDMNLGPNMDHSSYNQTANVFSTPFGEMTEEELAAAILKSSAAQTVPNDEANVLYQTSVHPK
jgi:hypothetical protein